MASKRRRGLPQLGALELAALEHLWEVGEADVLETHEAVGKPRGITPNTVGSALERLHKKGLTTRQKVSHAFRYRPKMERDTFRAQKLVEAAGGVRELAREGLLAAFVDLVADTGDAALDQLEELIKERRRERKP